MSEIGEKIIQAVRDVAAENPFHVYEQETCVYVSEGAPACLIGHALWKLDLIDAGLEPRCANEESADHLVSSLGLVLDYEELDWLTAAQEAQDRNNTWQDSIHSADRSIE